MNIPIFKLTFILLSLFPFISYGKEPCVRIFQEEPYVRIEYKENPQSLLDHIDFHTIHLNKLPSFIDHTLLRPEAKKTDIEKIVKEAMEFGFKAVCINSCNVSFVKSLLNKETTKKTPLIATVIGFPFGNSSTNIKIQEAVKAYKKGADELDMVINIGQIKEKDFLLAEKDIKAVVESTPLPVKVIIETGLLTRGEIISASKIVEAAQAHFVKTSTGFLGEGVKLEDILLIKESIAPNMQVKASGGIRNIKQALDLILVGADRLGLSSSVNLIRDRDKTMKFLKTGIDR